MCTLDQKEIRGSIPEEDITKRILNWQEHTTPQYLRMSLENKIDFHSSSKAELPSSAEKAIKDITFIGGKGYFFGNLWKDIKLASFCMPTENRKGVLDYMRERDEITPFDEDPPESQSGRAYRLDEWLDFMFTMKIFGDGYAERLSAENPYLGSAIPPATRFLIADGLIRNPYAPPSLKRLIPQIFIADSTPRYEVPEVISTFERHIKSLSNDKPVSLTAFVDEFYVAEAQNDGIAEIISRSVFVRKNTNPIFNEKGKYQGVDTTYSLEYERRQANYSRGQTAGIGSSLDIEENEASEIIYALENPNTRLVFSKFCSDAASDFRVNCLPRDDFDPSKFFTADDLKKYFFGFIRAIASEDIESLLMLRQELAKYFENVALSTVGDFRRSLHDRERQLFDNVFTHLVLKSADRMDIDKTLHQKNHDYETDISFFNSHDTISSDFSPLFFSTKLGLGLVAARSVYEFRLELAEETAAKNLDRFPESGVMQSEIKAKVAQIKQRIPPHLFHTDATKYASGIVVDSAETVARVLAPGIDRVAKDELKESLGRRGKSIAKLGKELQEVRTNFKKRILASVDNLSQNNDLGELRSRFMSFIHGRLNTLDPYSIKLDSHFAACLKECEDIILDPALQMALEIRLTDLAASLWMDPQRPFFLVNLGGEQEVHFYDDSKEWRRTDITDPLVWVTYDIVAGMAEGIFLSTILKQGPFPEQTGSEILTRSFQLFIQRLKEILLPVNFQKIDLQPGIMEEDFGVYNLGEAGGRSLSVVESKPVGQTKWVFLPTVMSDHVLAACYTYGLTVSDEALLDQFHMRDVISQDKHRRLSKLVILPKDQIGKINNI